MSFGNESKQLELKEVLFAVFKFIPYGCSVHVVGESSELGVWNPQEKNLLKWNKGHLWTGRINVPISIIEFKFVVVDESKGEIIEWEQGENRKLDFKNIERVFDAWKDHKSEHLWQKLG